MDGNWESLLVALSLAAWLPVGKVGEVGEVGEGEVRFGQEGSAGAAGMQTASNGNRKRKVSLPAVNAAFHSSGLPPPLMLPTRSNYVRTYRNLQYVT